SDQFVLETHPVLIRNAKIRTGHDDGKEVHGDMLLDRGLVVEVGNVSKKDLDDLKHIRAVDAKGRWVTAGLVDLHSHIGVESVPHLDGAADTNLGKTPILPWLRSTDTLNTHAQAFELTVSGGVTTVQVVEGTYVISGRTVYWEAKGRGLRGVIYSISIVIKLRQTDEKSTMSKAVESPQTSIKPSENVTHIHWQHMKHACILRRGTDAFCDGMKLSIHCYEAHFGIVLVIAHVVTRAHFSAIDLNMIIHVRSLTLSVSPSSLLLTHEFQLSNEFQFHVTSFHGGPPTIALFAFISRKKREACRNSEFALRILVSHRIPVVMKALGGPPTIALFAFISRKKREACRNSEFALRILSDHPMLNSRYLVFEAQHAHSYGLSTELTLASVITTPAKTTRLSHRVGFLSKGCDADSHPLVLGATPAQVFTDGIPQLKDPHILHKPHILQRPLRTRNFDKEARETVEFDGLPPLRPHHRRMFKNGEVVKLSNVSSVWLGGDEGTKGEGVLDEGQKDVYIRRGFRRIMMVVSTNDGNVPDALTDSVPSIVGGMGVVIRAVDGLAFNGRKLLHAYRTGITKAITAPTGNGFIQGLATKFSPGAETSLDHRAIIREEAAIHVTIGHAVDQSISTQVSALRGLLFASDTKRNSTSHINMDSVNIMLTLTRPKESYKRQSEAHLIAHEINYAKTLFWQLGKLPGAPLTHDGIVMKLLHAGVNVGIGVIDDHNARNTRFEVAWLTLNSFGEIGPWKALALVTVNLERALGGARRHGKKVDDAAAELVMYEGGGWMDFESRVVGVVSSERGITDLF
ncbi:hypothetical protein AN958_11763, partial [Leucoagaricus sp. SymC.cos]